MNPYAFSLTNNRSCCRQSNALDKSTNKAPHSPPLPRFFVHFSNIAINECWELYSFPLAIWCLDNALSMFLIDLIIKTTLEYFGYNRYNTNRSFIKRQTSDTSTSKEWQRVAMNDNEWYNERQRVTTNDNEWQQMTTSDSEWQRLTTSGHFDYFYFFSNNTGTYHYAP